MSKLSQFFRGASSDSEGVQIGESIFVKSEEKVIVRDNKVFANTYVKHPEGSIPLDPSFDFDVDVESIRFVEKFLMPQAIRDVSNFITALSFFNDGSNAFVHANKVFFKLQMSTPYDLQNAEVVESVNLGPRGATTIRLITPRLLFVGDGPNAIIYAYQLAEDETLTGATQLTTKRISIDVMSDDLKSFIGTGGSSYKNLYADDFLRYTNFIFAEIDDFTTLNYAKNISKRSDDFLPPTYHRFDLEYEFSYLTRAGNPMFMSRSVISQYISPTRGDFENMKFVATSPDLKDISAKTSELFSFYVDESQKKMYDFHSDGNVSVFEYDRALRFVPTSNGSQTQFIRVF